MNSQTKKEEILVLLKEKSQLKKSVFEKTKKVFSELKEVVFDLQAYLSEEVKGFEHPILVKANDRGQYEVRLTIAGDTIVFLMHSNVFDFPKSHRIHQNSYTKQGKGNSFCGMINVYNFLSDSFKYNRYNDVGYLVARIFVNNDLHFFVEGKKEMSFLFNDFNNSVIDQEQLKLVVESVIHYCLGFDLLTPPYTSGALVSVDEIQTVSSNMKLATGKRLGFKFSSDSEIL